MFVNPRFICWDCRVDNGCCLTHEDNGRVKCPYCFALNDLTENTFPAKRYVPKETEMKHKDTRYVVIYPKRRPSVISSGGPNDPVDFYLAGICNEDDEFKWTANIWNAMFYRDFRAANSMIDMDAIYNSTASKRKKKEASKAIIKKVTIDLTKTEMPD